MNEDQAEPIVIEALPKPTSALAALSVSILAASAYRYLPSDYSLPGSRGPHGRSMRQISKDETGVILEDGNGVRYHKNRKGTIRRITPKKCKRP